jgi:hypothetical protein
MERRQLLVDSMKSAATEMRERVKEIERDRKR